jgi:sugar phosphate isomerase/epimerase
VPTLKIGLDVADLRQPFRKALHTAARLAVDAVEIDARSGVSPGELGRTGVRQLRKMLDDLNLRVSAVRFRTRRGYDTAADLEPRIAATKAAMELAHDLGAGVVVNHVGRAAADPKSPDRRLLIEVLEELGRFGNRVGALLAAETGTESGPQLAALLAELPEGSIGIDLHPGNLVLNGYSPLEAVEALGPAILHVHASDAHRDPSGGYAGATALGQGAADLTAVLAALEGCGYRGYYTIQQTVGGDPERAAADAVRFLREL